MPSSLSKSTFSSRSLKLIPLSLHSFLLWMTMLHLLSCLDSIQGPTHADTHIDKLFVTQCNGPTEFKVTRTSTEHSG